MTNAEKARLREINEQIAVLMKEKAALNPYAGLKDMSNQEFGQGWSENWIRSKCSNLTKYNGSGHDLLAINGELWEVKSSRLPCKKTAFNQCHPYRCNRFLFVVYDTENGEETIYLVPAEDIKKKFHYYCQHSYEVSKEETDCVIVPYNTFNKKILEGNYKVNGWEALNALAS